MLHDGLQLLQFTGQALPGMLFLLEISQPVFKKSISNRIVLKALLLFFTGILSAQSPSFELLGTSDGLSQGMIYDLLQDRQGFLWFATRDGLNRYDGYSFQIFQNNPFDPFSIAGNDIQSLFEDHLGRIWAGTTNNGLTVLEPRTGKFYYLNNLSRQNISSLAETPDGSIWAGTSNAVNRIHIPDILPADQPDLKSQAIVDTFYWDDSLGKTNLPFHTTIDLLGSPDGKLWVSTLQQIGYFDTKTNRFSNV